MFPLNTKSSVLNMTRKSGLSFSRKLLAQDSRNKAVDVCRNKSYTQAFPVPLNFTQYQLSLFSCPSEQSEFVKKLSTLRSSSMSSLLNSLMSNSLLIFIISSRTSVWMLPTLLRSGTLRRLSKASELLCK